MIDLHGSSEVDIATTALRDYAKKQEANAKAEALRVCANMCMVEKRKEIAATARNIAYRIEKNANILPRGEAFYECTREEESPWSN